MPVLNTPITTLDEARAFLKAARKEELWRRDAASDAAGGMAYVVTTPADLGWGWRCTIHVSPTAALDPVALALIIQDSIKQAIKFRTQVLETP